MHFRCIAKMRQTAVMTAQGMYKYVCWMLSGMRFRLYIQFLDTLHWYSVLMHGYCHTAWYQVSSLRLSFRFHLLLSPAWWNASHWDTVIPKVTFPLPKKTEQPEAETKSSNHLTQPKFWMAIMLRVHAIHGDFLISSVSKKTLFQFKKTTPKQHPKKFWILVYTS